MNEKGSDERVLRIVGEVDPDQLECNQCRRFYHRSQITFIEQPSPSSRFGHGGSNEFVDFLRYRRLERVCRHCFNILRDAFNSGYVAGQNQFTNAAIKKREFEQIVKLHDLELLSHQYNSLLNPKQYIQKDNNLIDYIDKINPPKVDNYRKMIDDIKDLVNKSTGIPSKILGNCLK